jgi:hypothetical protein
MSGGLWLPTDVDVADALEVADEVEAGVIVVSGDRDIFAPLALHRTTSLWAPRCVWFISGRDVDAFRRDLQFATFLGLRAVMVTLHWINTISVSNLAQFASIVTAHAAASAHPAVWVAADGHEAEWRQWRRLQRVIGMCRLPPPNTETAHLRSGFVSLVLGFSEGVPAHRAFSGEHVVAVVSDATSVSLPWASRATIIVRVGAPEHLAALSDPAAAPHWSCPAYRAGTEARREDTGWRRRVALRSDDHAESVAQRMAPLTDQLQVPLQPLGDELPSGTYETFESDVPKYAAYEAAVRTAFRELSHGRVVVFVLGAGRGPLVTCCLQAADALPPSTKLIIRAVEKNPSATWYLQHRLHHDELWYDAGVRGRLVVEQGDMRCGPSVDLADDEAVVIVSELLGSFGDNELSPECVDAFLATERVRRHTGPLIVIPKSSTGFVTPVGSAVLADAVLQPIALARVGRGAVSSQAALFHTMYVTKAASFLPLAAASASDEDVGQAFQPAFVFEHGRPQPVTGSPRRCSCRYTVCDSGPLTGLLGAFRAVLHGDVVLSTVPDDHTPDMYSWYPAYMPLLFPGLEDDTYATSVEVDQGDVIEVDMTRVDGGRAVFYTWQARVLRGGATCLQSVVMNADGSDAIAK